jgi:hypothetical protein
VLVIGGGPSAAWAAVGAASASVRINSTAPSGQAMAVLDLAHRQHPTDRGVLMALVSITRESGRSPDDDWSAQIDPHRPRGPAPTKRLAAFPCCARKRATSNLLPSTGESTANLISHW